MGGNFDMSKIAEFVSQFVPEEVMAGAREGFAGKKDTPDTSKDFTPPADIFDTEDAYVVHISLPGAKKEDVGVNWDADKSELNVAGVIYRPGDEEFLKTLALDERKVGVFERKVKLGSKVNPAQVDSDSISAKMEDGILMITIPKLDNDIVDVKKVDIE
jgi:HSP20 family protein